MSEKEVSISVVKRMPRYFRYLEELKDKGVTRISSAELSQKMNITASQIRQDFNNFGCFGQQGYGYNVELLLGEITRILGLNREYNAIVIGAGNIGQGIVNYPEFSRHGFRFIAMFDINPKVIGLKINQIEVYDIDELENFLSGNEVQIAVLSVPANSAYKVARRLFCKNVKGIWNFTNVDLKAPEGIYVENVHMTDSLMTLVYRLND